MADKFDYNEAHADAVELISFFGQAGQVIKKGNASGWGDGKPIPAEPDVTIDGIITPLLQYKQSEIDGENILKTDSGGFLESGGGVEIGMYTTVNSKTFEIVDITTMTSVDDIKVYQRLQLRR